jgi:hypothetical protein
MARLSPLLRRSHRRVSRPRLRCRRVSRLWWPDDVRMPTRCGDRSLRYGLGATRVASIPQARRVARRAADGAVISERPVWIAVAVLVPSESQRHMSAVADLGRYSRWPQKNGRYPCPRIAAWVAH